MTIERRLSSDRQWKAHLKTLFSCRLCPAVGGVPVSGPVRGAKVMLVGQAPGPREESFGRPFAYTAGRRLFEWFAALGVPEESFRERVYIAAVIRCFPGRAAQGGDRVPDRDEIARCGAHLDREITLLQPELVIAVGTLAAKVLIGSAELAKIVGVIHRASRVGQSFDVIVLPHPSGRSTWLNKAENRVRLEESLQLLKKHAAFVGVVES